MPTPLSLNIDGCIEGNFYQCLPSTIAELTQILNTTTNTTTATTSLGTYQYIALGINIPFVPVFPILAIIIIVGMVSLRKEMNRNQKILYSILLALSISSSINMITRIASELAYISTNPQTVLIVFSIVKAFDRNTVSITSFWVFLLVTFISDVFLVTTVKVGAISQKKFKILRGVLLAFTILLFLIIAGVCIVMFVTGGVTARFGNTTTTSYLTIFALLVAAIAFTVLCSLVLIILHYIGQILLRSLNTGVKKINKEVNRQSTAVKPRAHSKLNAVASINVSLQTKKTALKKALAILLGVTISLIFQFIGFFCIPLSLLNNYIMLVFFALHDVTLASILILFLVIYRPLRDIHNQFNNNEKRLSMDESSHAKTNSV